MASGHDKLARMKRRIYQMLAKAESTTAEEAAALEEAAERLMVKYGVSKAMLEDQDNTKPNIVELRIDFDTQWQTAWLHGFSRVATALRCTPLIISRKGQCTLFIVGFKSDAEMAERLISSLKLQSVGAMETWWRVGFKEFGRFLTSHERHVEKRTFMEFFGIGAAVRIADAMKAEISESGTSTEVVLASREAVVNDYVTTKLNPTKGRARRGSEGAAGGRAGYAAGYAAADSSNSRSLDKSRAAIE